MIEYDITNQFSVVTTYTQSGDTQVRGFDQSEFTIDIKGRKRFPSERAAALWQAR